MPPPLQTRLRRVWLSRPPSHLNQCLLLPQIAGKKTGSASAKLEAATQKGTTAAVAATAAAVRPVLPAAPHDPQAVWNRRATRVQQHEAPFQSTTTPRCGVTTPTPLLLPLPAAAAVAAAGRGEPDRHSASALAGSECIDAPSPRHHTNPNLTPTPLLLQLAATCCSPASVTFPARARPLLAIGINRASTSDLDEAQLRQVFADQQAFTCELQGLLSAARQEAAAQRSACQAAEARLSEERASRKAAEQDAADLRWLLACANEAVEEAVEAASQAGEALCAAQQAAGAAEEAAVAAQAAATQQAHLAAHADQLRRLAQRGLRREKGTAAAARLQLERRSEDQRLCVQQALEDAAARQGAEKRAAEADVARYQAQQAAQQARQELAGAREQIRAMAAADWLAVEFAALVQRRAAEEAAMDEQRAAMDATDAALARRLY